MKKIRFSISVGWLGAFLIILAHIISIYNLFSSPILISSPTLIYMTLISIGALGVAINSFNKKAYPSATIFVIWMIVHLFQIFQLIF